MAGSFAPALVSAKSQGESSPCCQEEIAAECKRVRQALTRVVFSQSQENIVERFIQYHQTGIIELADELQPYLTAADEPRLKLVIGFFISRLFELLSYIEKFFAKYFNAEARIPEAYRLVAMKQLNEPVTNISNLVEEFIGSAALKQCIFHYLRSFREEQFPEGINFRNLMYLKTFLAELEQLFQLKDVINWEARLSAALIYLNFNHLEFLTYWQDSVRAELENAENKDQYLVCLSRALTNIKSQQSKPGLSYHPAWPNIKTMLETWLSDEVSAAILQPARDILHGQSLTETSADKITLNQSVAQIGCLQRLLYEEGYYATQSVTDVFKFTVRHFRSKRQQQISTGSLSKEYYGVNQVTAAVVRDLLQRMIARLNKNYFP